MNGTRATGGVRAQRGGLGPVRTAVACATLACLVLTGASCAPAQPSPGGSGAPERTGAPRVDEPLATEAKTAYPCASLTDAHDAVFHAAVDTFGVDGAPGPCDAARKAAESVVDNLRQNPAA
ncbi:hypothetical protein ACFWQ9_07045 [Streptomyces albidoflavus]|uniref:Uncharacterized protein n=1 Tax=Streptomyces albidoflavus TaxID=1886 RepID=A0AB37X8R9_9ACTN|nr:MULTISPECIES: hypothetical protein [Streptomyces]QLA59082.1 hypothetical protein HWN34_22270 [Streptomyces violascens]AWL32095.1 hypothetical protein B9S66_07830 [Streptomyces sp. SM17]MCO6697107.1 hypothetical protein [Streptomyces sp. Vc17.3-30]RZE35611.1 hypothetical protein C0Q91_23205 [Streptomyces albidoflavus]RZE75381.1 hypothetical protein C0R02_22345 [Streptomyces albidoflavus]